MKRFFILFILMAFHAFAEDIEEAKGLPEESPAKTSRSLQDKWRHRIYLLGEGISQKSDSRSVTDYGNFEASASVDYGDDKLKYFIDGIADIRSSGTKVSLLNQIGVRYLTEENVNLSIGKERNKRSPGIITSPSDFVFGLNAVPGLREDREGVWLARASKQIEKVSYDVMFLLASSQDAGGWPQHDNRYKGTVVRSLQQYENLDVSVAAGTIDSVMRAGIALQGFLQKIWKTYYEVGYKAEHQTVTGSQLKQVTQHLLGLGYEGSEDYSVRVEYYYNGQGLDADQFETFKTLAGFTSPSQISTDFLFLRKQYGIFNFSALEIKDRLNFIVSIIKSLEDTGSSSVLRAEWLINDHLVTGVTGIFINGDSGSQYFLAPFNQQYSLDLKYTF